MLLGEETSGNHQAYRKGHLDITMLNEINAAKYETQKPSTCCATLSRCKFLSMFPVINFSRNKNICCGLKKVVTRVYFEQQILALLLVFSSNSQLVAQQICSCPCKSTNQRAAFLQPATNVFIAGQVDQAR